MADSLAGVVLAAGAGTRLRPLTYMLPKALCPVGDRALLDHALDAVGAVVGEGPAVLAVNVHHRGDDVVAHLAARAAAGGEAVHVSVERERALGTAGALVWLARWLEGRPALVVNADTWHRLDLGVLRGGWDGVAVRVLTTTPGPFGPGSTVVASLVPAAAVCELAERLTDADGTVRPAGLWEALWADEVAAGRLETVHADGPAIDCGTPAGYLAANLAWSDLEAGGGSVVGAGAVVEGEVQDCVVWPGSRVERGERLVRAVRAAHVTVLVR